MFKVLVDTCVWLDLAKDSRSGALLDGLETLTKRGEVELLVPRVVLDEFARNRARVKKEGTQSLSSAVRRVREAVASSEKKHAQLAGVLNDIDLELPSMGEAMEVSLARMERILCTAPVLEPSRETMARAADRALGGKAPFHRNKNAIGDAILVESYAEAVGAKPVKGVRFAFVTHNKHDFSMPNGDERTPHPDLAHLFTKIRSLYCITLADMLQRADAELLTEEMMYQEWLEEPRSATAIGEAIGELLDKVWYSRHKLREEMIDTGRIRLVAEKEYEGLENKRGVIRRDIWRRAQKAARKVEGRLGKEALGPWGDFEWGMLSGKLSALRWVMGDDWDNLDT